MSERTRSIQEDVIRKREELRKDADMWKGFLKNMTYRSKYRFEQQMMIYFQAPESTAVATYDTWNERTNRYVLRGSTGIALFAIGEPDRAVYVFDVSATEMNKKKKENPLDLFAYREADMNDVREEFRSFFHDSISDNTTMDGVLFVSAIARSEAYIDQHLDELLAAVGSTGTTEQLEARKEDLLRFISASSLYSLICRCYDASYAEDMASQFYEFNTDRDLFDDYESMYAIGNAVQYVTAQIMDRLSVVYRRNMQAERQAQIDAMKRELEDVKEKTAEVENDTKNTLVQPDSAVTENKPVKNVSESDTSDAHAAEKTSAEEQAAVSSAQNNEGKPYRESFTSFEDALSEKQETEQKRASVSQETDGQLNLFDMMSNDADPEMDSFVQTNAAEENTDPVSIENVSESDTALDDERALGVIKKPTSEFNDLAEGDTIVDSHGILWRVDRVDWALSLIVDDANVSDTQGMYAKAIWNWQQRLADTGFLDDSDDYRLISREDYAKEYDNRAEEPAPSEYEASENVSESDTFETAEPSVPEAASEDPAEENGFSEFENAINSRMTVRFNELPVEDAYINIRNARKTEFRNLSLQYDPDRNAYILFGSEEKDVTEQPLFLHAFDGNTPEQIWQYVTEAGYTVNSYVADSLFNSQEGEVAQAQDVSQDEADKEQSRHVIDLSSPEASQNMIEVPIEPKEDEVKLKSIVIDLRPREEEQEELPLTADDITNLRFIGSTVSNYGFGVDNVLEADIRGQKTKIYYNVAYGDGDEERFSIHTDENDIWDRLSGPELNRLEDRLSDEVRIGHYLNDINGATDLQSLKELEYSYMEDETFPRWLAPRFWDAYNQREKMLSSVPELEGETAETESFHISDDNLGVGSAKDKYWKNTSAIILLKQLEAEDRPATFDEKHFILSQYVGWGGLPDAFDENKPAWKEEYAQLKKLLTEEEYEAARASTLNAHYTSPVVIRAMYDVIERMGFRSGNILEPALGVGNFFGMLPSSMKDSRLYGTELDSISGRIAQKIYPEAHIRVEGYETAKERGFFDLAIGNVPFGNYRVNDPDYNHLKFSIHNYFFAKALDQVRVGGIVAFVTSRFTMDQKDNVVRRYIADRADLLGAIRLPRTAFQANAGTSVVTDILFLQRRDTPVAEYPDWVNVDADENGLIYNKYFIEHPDMVLGTVSTESTQYGQDAFTVIPKADRSLESLLEEAGRKITGHYEPQEILFASNELGQENVLPATPDIKNFSYAVINDKVYYRQDTVLVPFNGRKGDDDRIRQMVEIRDVLNDVIRYQQENYPQEVIEEKQAQLNSVYDAFVEKYGRISTSRNEGAFRDDSSYFLLSSLEVLNNNGEFERKADIFTARTIRPAQAIDHVDTPAEALAVSISEYAAVDLPYMASLLGGSETIPKIVEQLQGVIFKTPSSGVFDPENITDEGLSGWQTADEYLSGNVRQKLRAAQEAAQEHPEFNVNVTALEQVQPVDLDASEIDVRLGATWIPVEYIQDFMNELLEIPYFKQPHDSQWYSDRSAIRVSYATVTSEWSIANKSVLSGVLINNTYGTERVNAFYVLESTLNLKDVRVFDTERDSEGHERRILNRKETMLAQQKQQAMKAAFRDWIWKDPDRRHDLITVYNERFNSIRTREYDGSHITFAGINPNIELRDHQRAAIARILYGGNTLLAHEVGAGKTFEMIASAMESKRLGLSRKALFVVPNHLTLQWAGEFLRLYPGANLLVASKADFETKNRKRFCARIATGNYDGIIIGHSQFKKLALSPERQERLLREQIAELAETIAAAKYTAGERFSIKQMEKTKKTLESNLAKLVDSGKKDDVITFEQLGIDRLYVDESQAYKNLSIYTKMRNVPGISPKGSAAASDMFMKCRYMDEITGGKGIVFATGTPISNSMSEMYSLMRYLQYDLLQRMGLNSFDSWAATFGEAVTAIELAPEGTGYRARTRFSRFFNLPELMSLFKEVADIKTADVLDIPGLPEAVFENVAVEASETQKEMIDGLSVRAAAVHDGNVNPRVDNMLKITSDGRKIGLDQRLMNPQLPDDPSSKVNTCIEKIFEIWEDTAENRSTQLVFCDQSIPKEKNADNPLESFNIYDDIKDKLIARGVPSDEIAFIHSAKDDKEKKKLFDKVNAGQVRVLIGSTQKMGAGTNVQTRLIALHHLDAPWRPSDMTQRNGRIIRQNNMNSEVKIYTYVTKGTFDAYLYQMLENKQKFIGQIMTSRTPVRFCEDFDEQALSYAEVKALCAGNPLIKERMELDVDVAKLRMLKSDYMSTHYRLEDDIATKYPERISILTERVKGLKSDLEHYESVKPASAKTFSMTIQNKVYDKTTEAGAALLDATRSLPPMQNYRLSVGEYLGHEIQVGFDPVSAMFHAYLKRATTLDVVLGTDAYGNIARIMNTLNGIEEQLTDAQKRLEDAQHQLALAKEELKKPFAYAEELKQKEARLAELDILLNMDEPEGTDIGALEIESSSPEEDDAIVTETVEEEQPSAETIAAADTQSVVFTDASAPEETPAFSFETGKWEQPYAGKNVSDSDTSAAEPDSDMPLPYIHCEWSENPAFREDSDYTIAEFDALMAKLDSEHCEGARKMREKYGSDDAWYESGDDLTFFGYDKTKFTVYFQDGTSTTERQDIGDGDGGVIDFLRQYEQFARYIPELEEARDKELAMQQTTSDSKEESSDPPPAI